MKYTEGMDAWNKKIKQRAKKSKKGEKISYDDTKEFAKMIYF
jgi:hypothetical protein